MRRGKKKKLHYPFAPRDLGYNLALPMKASLCHHCVTLTAWAATKKG